MKVIKSEMKQLTDSAPVLNLLLQTYYFVDNGSLIMEELITNNTNT